MTAVFDSDQYSENFSFVIIIEAQLSLNNNCDSMFPVKGPIIFLSRSLLFCQEYNLSDSRNSDQQKKSRPQMEISRHVLNFLSNRKTKKKNVPRKCSSKQTLSAALL